MRFSVRQADVCAGKEKRTLRKGAFWRKAITERRTLHAVCDGKAHSGCESSRKGALCDRGGYRMRLFVRLSAQNALFREAGRRLRR